VNEFREESEQHVVHRLEAFSDIVIGFSLAQLTFDLVLPTDALDLFTKNVLSLVAFAATFGIVAGMWWSHHRLFTNFFVPTRLNIVLTFLSLGGVLFLVYSLQVWLHAERHVGTAYAMYTGAMAWVIGLVALLMYRGVLLRGHRMVPKIARNGRRRAFRLAIMATFLGVLAVLNAVSSSARVGGTWITITGFAALGLYRLFDEHRKSRSRTDEIAS
jgi:uncharacterized membrane protein